MRAIAIKSFNTSYPLCFECLQKFQVGNDDRKQDLLGHYLLDGASLVPPLALVLSVTCAGLDRVRCVDPFSPPSFLLLPPRRCLSSISGIVRM